MKILMQQLDANGGQGASKGAGAAGDAGAGAGGAGAAGGAGTQGQGQQQGQQGSGAQGAAGKAGEGTGTTTNDGKGTADTSAWKPTAFVPKLPEGKTVDKDPVVKEYFTEFNAIFDNAKLSTEGKMQALVDLQMKFGDKAKQAAQQREREENDRIATQPARDLETLKADKDFGGPNYQATIDGAKRIELYAFGEDLNKLLGPLGMQSDPVLLKGFARLARVISDDVIGNANGREEQPADEIVAMFPNSHAKMRKSQGGRA